MGREKKKAKAKAALFKRLHGVKPDTFEKMRSILQKEYEILHEKGGKPPKLTVADKLSITLKYLREYRTMDSIAAEYGVCKGSVCMSIQWVEDTLSKDGIIPKKKTADSLHIAYSTVFQMDILLSWNFKHLANINKEQKIIILNKTLGYNYIP